MRRFLAVILLTLSSPTAFAEGLEGRIWDVSAHSFISREEAARRMTAADFLLLGERHDNAEHHRLQAWAIEQITAAGRRPAAAFEMIGPEQQAVLVQPATDADALAAALDWPHSGWPDFALYRPVFQAVLKAGLPILPANVAKDELRAIAHGESIPPNRILFLRLDKPLPGPLADGLAQDVRDAHCGQIPEAAIPGMIAAQRARDAAMAHAMADNTLGSAVLIAGAGHIRKDRGVPRILESITQDRRILSVGFVEVDAAKADAAAYDAPYDLAWFTSAAPPIDGCAEMAKRKKGK
ncbi:MAG TPA: ChaN family lipoprotein [Candidatus Sulfotelmatobacter sp.]|jgi:uncharacterized iron-regulated protein|nr:ChaN family lipoprotein [Candidatus Sulfotelmatobacter sp.]